MNDSSVVQRAGAAPVNKAVTLGLFIFACSSSADGTKVEAGWFDELPMSGTRTMVDSLNWEEMA